MTDNIIIGDMENCDLPDLNILTCKYVLMQE
ncbi:hypothetical protein SIN8267_01869 [Sinobacterium norvegicum]|uniref:Uncharacterized protein n=1 Tax=Sinobacterium norvegicum TaxID=1641715 RepID=A0ABN8EKR6_9GAMM|nr:hypothetical protein SIN8267_01869 [Sinobacterium norvegicum]